MSKRILAMLLCLALCVSLIPAAYAGDVDDIVIVGEEALPPEEAAEDIEIDRLEEDVAPAEKIEPAEDAPVPADEFVLIDGTDAAPLPAADEIEASVLYSGTCGEGMIWKLYDNGVLFVDGNGAIADYERGGAPWYQYRSQITALSIDYGVTGIGSYAFSGCYKLASITSSGYGYWPTSLKSIGECAFMSCTSLTYVQMVSTVDTIGKQAFCYCSGIKYLTFEGHPSIGSWCFGDCTGLKEISFINKYQVPEIASNAFSKIDASSTVTAKVWYPPEGTAWTSAALKDYGGSLTWTAGYHGWCGDNIVWDFDPSEKHLSLSGSGPTWEFPGNGWTSFDNLRTNIITAEVGEGITVLTRGTMAWLCWMTDVSLPSTLTEIGDQAFALSPDLTKVTIPKNVKKIGYRAFSYFQGDEQPAMEFIFEGHAPTLDPDAFAEVEATITYYPLYSWDTVAKKDYGGSLTWVKDDKIGANATWYLALGNKLNIYGTGATWDYPDEYPAFYQFRSEVKSVWVSYGITELGQYLFWRMDSIASVTWYDNGIEKLDYGAFGYCTALKEIKIPFTVTTIGERVFAGCTALKKVSFEGHAPTIAGNAFQGVTATGYYPPVYSWTEDKLGSYGGTLGWVKDDQIGDAVTWSLSAGGTLNIVGSDEIWDFPDEFPNFYWFTNEITYVSVGYGVTVLGGYLFYNMDQVTWFSLPNTLEEVGQSAFYGCDGVEEIVFPAGVTYIGKDACGSCDKLKKIRFFGHAPTIGSTAFDDVSATANYFPVYSWTPDRMKDYGDGTMTWICDDGCGDSGGNVVWYLDETGVITLTGSGATSAAYGTTISPFWFFKDEITGAVIGEGVTDLNDNFFESLDKLASVRLPSTLKRIGPVALARTAISEIDVPAGVTEIGRYAFSECGSLKKITFRSSAPSFGQNCFQDVTATAWYPASDATWTADVRKDYGGHITWTPFTGYAITVGNFTKGIAACSLSPGAEYLGETTFSVSSEDDKAVVVAIKNGESYTRLTCTTSPGGTHFFTVNVSAPVEIAIALKGDVNLDGAIKGTDGTMLKRAVLGSYKLISELAFLAADINGDGILRGSEGTQIARSILGTFTIKW